MKLDDGSQPPEGSAVPIAAGAKMVTGATGIEKKYIAPVKKINEMVEPKTKDWFKFSEKGIPLKHEFQKAESFYPASSKEEIEALMRAMKEKNFPGNYGIVKFYESSQHGYKGFAPGTEEFVTDKLKFYTKPLELEGVAGEFAMLADELKSEGRNLKLNPITADDLAKRFNAKHGDSYIRNYILSTHGNSSLDWNEFTKDFLKSEVEKYIADLNITHSASRPKGSIEAQVDLAKKMISPEGVNALWGFTPDKNNAYRVVRRIAPYNPDTGKIGPVIDPSFQDFKNYGVVRGTQVFQQDAYSNKQNPLPNYWGDYESPDNAKSFEYSKGVSGIPEGSPVINAGNSIYEFDVDKIKSNPAYRVVNEHDNVGKALQRYLVLNQQSSPNSILGFSSHEMLKRAMERQGIYQQHFGDSLYMTGSIGKFDAHSEGPGQATLAENQEIAKKQILQRETGRINQAKLANVNVDDELNVSIKEDQAYLDERSKSIKETKDEIKYSEKRLAELDKKSNILYEKHKELIDRDFSSIDPVEYTDSEKEILSEYRRVVREHRDETKELMDLNDSLDEKTNHYEETKKRFAKWNRQLTAELETIKNAGRQNYSVTGNLLDKALPHGRDGIRHRTQTLGLNEPLTIKSLKQAGTKTGIVLPDSPSVPGYGTRFDELQFPENRPTWTTTYDKITPFEDRPFGVHWSNIKTDAEILKNYAPLIKESIASDLRVAKAVPKQGLKMAADSANWLFDRGGQYATDAALATGRTLMKVGDRAFPYLVVGDALHRKAAGMDRGEEGKTHGSTYMTDALANGLTFGGWDFLHWYTKANEEQRQQHWDEVGQRQYDDLTINSQTY